MNLARRSTTVPNIRALTWAFASLTALLYVVAFASGCPKADGATGDPIVDIDDDDEAVVEDTCQALDTACDEDRPCCAGSYCAQWVNAYLEEPHACLPLEQAGTYCTEDATCASGECTENVCVGGDVLPPEPEPEAEPICAAEDQSCTTVTCCDGLVCVATADSALCEPEVIAPSCTAQNEACDGATCCAGLGCFNGACVSAPTTCESDGDCDGAPCTEGHCDACGTDGDICFGSGGCCAGQYCRITGYIDGVCEPKVPLGGTCIFWESCGDGLFCSDGACAALYSEGVACDGDYLCASQFCSDGTCAALLGVSATCLASHHCASGACLNGQCQ